jgi:hypothetical protein
MTQEEKKQIYNSVMEAASQSVINMLMNEDYFDKNGIDLTNSNPADEVTVDIKTISGSFVEESSGKEGTFHLTAQLVDAFFYFEVINRAAIINLSDFFLQFMITAEDKKEWKEIKKANINKFSSNNTDELSEECYFSVFSDNSDLNEMLKKLKMFLKKYAVNFDYKSKI